MLDGPSALPTIINGFLSFGRELQPCKKDKFAAIIKSRNIIFI
jgi:hypothetical protein